MERFKSAFAAGAALLAAACNQGDSGNVMAPPGNALSPAQVDAALGPELANTANAVEPGNAANASDEAAGTVQDAAPAARDEEAEPVATSPEPATDRSGD